MRVAKLSLPVLVVALDFEAKLDRSWSNSWMGVRLDGLPSPDQSIIPEFPYIAGGWIIFPATVWCQ